jgi:hypothetical protein
VGSPDRAPVPGADRLHVPHTDVAVSGLAEETDQGTQVRSEDVSSPQIQEDALFDLAVLTVTLDEAEVLVEGTFFGCNCLAGY